jgi:CRP/FNR family transcriptional regulator, cyclic AMP receptor protein
VRKVLFLFRDLSDADIEWLAVTGERRQVPKATILIQEGKPVQDLYILLEGQLTVLVSSLDKQFTVNTLQKGEVIGELSFLDSRPPSATVVAATDAVLLAIPREKLKAKLTRDVFFAAKFYRSLGVFLADRLRSNTRRLGYGNSVSLRPEDSTADEIDPELLESVGLAAKRFELLVEHLKTGKAAT